MASKRFKRKIGETNNPMVTKKKDSIITSSETPTSTPELLPPSEWLQGWNKLEVRIQDRVRTRHLELVKVATGFEQTVAMMLIEFRKDLLPARMYEVYLKGLEAQKILARATANRYVRKYEILQAKLPAPVFAAAIKDDRKINLSLIEHIPPPKGDNEEENQVWLDRVTDRNTARAMASKKSDLDDYHITLKNNIAAIKNDYNNLPNNAKTRQRWITDLCGMILWTGNIQTAQTIAPQAIPEKLETKRGRPKGSTKGA